MDTTLVQTVVVPHAKAAGTSWSITLDQPATFGNTLVVGALGGAIATPSSPTGWTRPLAYNTPATLDLSCWTKTAAGGETTISGTLNGSGDNVVLYFMELPGSFTFSSGSNGASAGVTLSDTTDFTVAPTSAVTVASKSLLVGLFAILQSTAFADDNQFTGCTPAGARAVSSAEQDASGHQVIVEVTIADVDAGSYKATSQYLGSAPGKAYAVQLAFTNNGGMDAVQFANDIERANAKVGRRRQSWYNVKQSGSIAGFPTALSVLPGDDIGFKVDSLGSAWTAEIVRLGWNGHYILGAATVATLTGTVTSQPTPAVDGTTGGTSASNWTQNLTWSVPDDAVPGYYGAVFRTTAGALGWAHFLVRSPTLAGKVVIVSPEHTHHAYNAWGATTDSLTVGFTGRMLYGDGGDLTNFAERAYSYSFDRTMATGDTTGQTYIWDSEYPLIQVLEAWGYDLAYVTDVDLETDVLDFAATVILLGHHEYWTAGIYDTVLNAQAAGVNMLIYSANTAGWRVRIDPDDSRNVLCYKDDGTRDNEAGVSGTGFNPSAEWTGAWRDPTSAGGIANDDIRLDNTLTGCRFVASGPVPGDALVYAASALPHVRSSSALAAGKTDTTANLGFELDSADGALGQPSNLVTLYSTDVAITTGANAAGTVYSTHETISATQVLWRHASGALIWKSAGWRDWRSASHYQGGTPVSSVDVDIQQYLANLLYDLGAVPATLRALAPGDDTDPTDPATGAPAGGRNAVAIAYGLDVPSTSGTAGFFALVR
jgi:hypothetical protein